MPSARKKAKYTLWLSTTSSHRVPAGQFQQLHASNLITLRPDQPRVADVARGVFARVVNGVVQLFRGLTPSIPSNWQSVERAYLYANAGQHPMPLGFSENEIWQRITDPAAARAEIDFLRQHPREWDIRICHTVTPAIP